MLQFILERYNYWIVIILMMMGLYIVFSRGNLVKKIIGLNIFQTSVFIFYITVGKIAGGTAPIFIGGYGKDDSDHGVPAGDGDHGAAGVSDGEINLHADGATPDTPPDTAGIDPGASLPAITGAGDSVGAKTTNQFPDLSSNQVLDIFSTGASVGGVDEQSLHTLPETITDHEAVAGKITNSVFADVRAALDGHDGMRLALENGTTDIAGTLAEAVASPETEIVQQGVDYAGGVAAHGVADTIYTNPLVHVLILTAIVVGVATTAVGLALAVRIREAYGTIEEDELEAADDIAEFGRAASFATEGDDAAQGAGRGAGQGS